MIKEGVLQEGAVVAMALDIYCREKPCVRQVRRGHHCLNRSSQEIDSCYEHDSHGYQISTSQIRHRGSSPLFLSISPRAESSILGRV